MKTERRHELQTNKLADWLGHQVEQLRPHAKMLIGLGVLGAAIVVTVILITKDRESALEVARNDFYIAMAARDRDALENVAKTHTGTVVELWAKQAQADIDLENGLRALYTNRDEAYRSLDDAKDAYNEVVTGAASHPELLQHSLLGLAQVNEATSNLEKSREYYEQVSRQFADTPIAVLAKSRLEALDDPQTEKWYNWFGRQKPKPPTSNSLPGLPGLPGMPDDLTKLPDRPDLPIFPGFEKPAGDEKQAGTSDSPVDPAASDAGKKAGEASPGSELPADKTTEPGTTAPAAAPDSPTTTPGAAESEPPSAPANEAEPSGQPSP